MPRRIRPFNVVCVLVAVLVVFALAAAGAQPDAQHARKAQLNSLILAAKLLERQLDHVVTQLELISEQYSLFERKGVEEQGFDWVKLDILTSEFIQQILWVNNQGGVFRTYPESALSNGATFVGPAVFRLIRRSVREKRGVASSIVSPRDESRGLWVAFPVFKDGSHIYSVVGAIDLEWVGRMVAPSLRQKIFILDEEGQFSLSNEGLPDFVGWDTSLVLSDGATSIVSSLTGLVSARIAGVLQLTEPAQTDRKEPRVIQMVVAPFTFLDRKLALCSLHPIAGANVLVTKQEYPMLLPLALSIIAAVLSLLVLGVFARHLRTSVGSEEDIPDVSAPGRFPLSNGLLGALPIPAFVADAGGRLVTANPAFYFLLQVPTFGHLSGRRLDAIFCEQSKDKTKAFIEAVLAAGSARTEMLLRGSQDEIVEVPMCGVAVNSGGEEQILVMCNDNTSTSQGALGGTQTAIAEESYLEAVLNGLSEAVMIVGSDYSVKRANTNLLKLVGETLEDKVFGRCCYEVFHGRDKPCSGQKTSCPVREVLAKDHSISVVHLQADQDGSERFLEVFACPLKAPGREPEVLVSLKDITEKTQLSVQLARADKLKALGEMASGVAHDFNNLLGVILGRAQMLIRMIGGSDPGTKRNLEIIERTALDGAETVRRIQEFAKVGDKSSFVPVDLNEIIEDSIGITKPRWKDQMQVEGFVVEVKLTKSNIPRVPGKPSELREIFVNLINNAIDAMPEGGRIALETRARGGNVNVLVRDSGEGISPEARDKIFDPFFTTREPTNSGLGLSIVLGIVQRHGGAIDVKSELGEFTEFRVQIPALLNDFREAERPKIEQIEPEPALVKARVLIIDDEAAIRNLLVDMLAGEGHDVDIASSGEEGIRKCKRRNYHYVITDLGMPHMSGWEVARKVKELRPETTVILATGWGIHFDEDKLKSAGINRVITKPFQVDEVLTCINGRH